MPAITVGPHYGQSPIVIMPSADGFVETFQPFWFQVTHKNGLGTPLGGQNGTGATSRTRKADHARLEGGTLMTLTSDGIWMAVYSVLMVLTILSCAYFPA
jgi:hypothetical protein